MGAAMSLALVAVVGVPLALVALREEQTQVDNGRDAPANAQQAQPAQSEAALPETRPTQAKGAPEQVATIVTPAPLQSVPTLAPAADIAAPEPQAGGVAAAPPPPAPPPPSLVQRSAIPVETTARRQSGFAANAPLVVAKARTDDSAPIESIVLAGSRIRSSAESDRTRQAEESGATESIVVSGSRRRSPAEAARARRGDWNACTVDDPDRSLDGCKRLINPAEKGAAERAAAHVSDGLALAWDGDNDGAIEAFGAAIALDPRMAFAYLNRGLAYRQQGEAARAMADFDKAVRYAPSQARGYYHRSIALREKGDKRRAAADESRAVELDSRYESLFD